MAGQPSPDNIAADLVAQNPAITSTQDIISIIKTLQSQGKTLLIKEPEEDYYVGKRSPTVELECVAFNANHINFWCGAGRNNAVLKNKSGGFSLDLSGTLSGYQYYKNSVTVDLKDVTENTFKPYVCYCEVWPSPRPSVGGVLPKVFSKDITITAANLSARFKTSIPSLDVALYSSPTLPCSPPRGKPDPKVYWLKNGEPVAAPRYVMDKNFSLDIKDAVPEDAGEYVCVAENEQAKRLARGVKLTVTDKHHLVGGRREPITTPTPRPAGPFERVQPPWDACPCDGPSPPLQTRRVGNVLETRPCVRPASCTATKPRKQWGPWSEWGNCASDCTQVRSRPCLHSGTCDGLGAESRTCSTPECSTRAAESAGFSSEWVLGGSVAALLILTGCLIFIGIICRQRRRRPRAFNEVLANADFMSTRQLKDSYGRPPDTPNYAATTIDRFYRQLNLPPPAHYVSVPTGDTPLKNSSCSSSSSPNSLQQATNTTGISPYHASSTIPPGTPGVNDLLLHRGGPESGNSLSHSLERQPHSAALPVGPEGAHWVLQQLGVTVLLPPDAVSHHTEIYISVSRDERETPRLAEQQTQLTAAVHWSCATEVHRPLVLTLTHCAARAHAPWQSTLLASQRVMPGIAPEWRVASREQSIMQLDASHAHILTSAPGWVCVVGESSTRAMTPASTLPPGSSPRVVGSPARAVKRLRVLTFLGAGDATQLALRVRAVQDCPSSVLSCQLDEQRRGSTPLLNSTSLLLADGAGPLRLRVSPRGSWKIRGNNEQEMPFSRVWGSEGVTASFQLQQSRNGECAADLTLTQVLAPSQSTLLQLSAHCVGRWPDLQCATPAPLPLCDVTRDLVDALGPHWVQLARALKLENWIQSLDELEQPGEILMSLWAACDAAPSLPAALRLIGRSDIAEWTV